MYEQLKQVLMEELLKISFDDVKKLYDSIPGRIEAVHKAGREQTP